MHRLLAIIAIGIAALAYQAPAPGSLRVAAVDAPPLRQAAVLDEADLGAWDQVLEVPELDLILLRRDSQLFSLAADAGEALLLEFVGMTLRIAGPVLTSVPFVPPPAPDADKTRLAFPQVADGGAGSLSISTTVALFNHGLLAPPGLGKVGSYGYCSTLNAEGQF